ncbi:aldo/keto reductase [Rathayibacter soli]|uniref:aldo/keto reductase n=1 Tax=Rathayibacter soli TaxID=3144168 RepID=UPI0027E556F6|nr:aldo/keto reductase [Glaciibacter superstes]
MKYTHLGASGLEISSVVLGCMSFGAADRGEHSWTLGLEDSRALIRQALELGITTFDTANVYSAGSSEEIVGHVLNELTRREGVVIATKVCDRTHPGPGGAGLSRGAIMHEIDESLRRLNTDYIDLYQVHHFDPDVPIEETMEALHDVVKAGKTRYIGASSMFTWQFAEMQRVADVNGWTRFVSMQDQYNLLSREEEREMHPYCLETHAGVLAWSPLARGKLTRPWDASTERSETDEFGKTLYHQFVESDQRVVQAVAAVAAARGVSRAQIALSWVTQQSAVTAPIIGATKRSHLDDAIAAVDVVLDEEELTLLKQYYVPHAIEGF